MAGDVLDRDYQERIWQERFISAHQRYFIKWNRYTIINIKSVKERKFMKASYFEFDIVRSEDVSIVIFAADFPIAVDILAIRKYQFKKMKTKPILSAPFYYVRRYFYPMTYSGTALHDHPLVCDQSIRFASHLQHCVRNRGSCVGLSSALQHI